MKVEEPGDVSIPLDLLDFDREHGEAETWEVSIPSRIKREVCETFEIDSMEVKSAGEKSSKDLKRYKEEGVEEEFGVAKREIRKLNTDEERTAYIVANYLGPGKSLRSIPKDVLDGLGVELVKVQKGKQSFLSIALKEEQEMKKDHKTTVRRFRKPHVRKNSRRAIR